MEHLLPTGGNKLYEINKRNKIQRPNVIDG